MTKIVWKEIPGYPGYEVTKNGKIRSWLNGGANGRRGGSVRLKKPVSISPLPHRGGYLQFWPYVKGKRRYLLVHKAVALAFIGPARGREVDHENRKRRDNRLSNLRYLSKLENGQRSKTNLLTVSLVKEAREKFAAWDVSASDLAKEYGVAIPTMCQALDGTTWANAGGPLAVGNKKAKLKDEDLFEIVNRLTNGDSKTDIAKDYGVTRQAIRMVPERVKRLLS